MANPWNRSKFHPDTFNYVDRRQDKEGSLHDLSSPAMMAEAPIGGSYARDCLSIDQENGKKRKPETFKASGFYELLDLLLSLRTSGRSPRSFLLSPVGEPWLDCRTGKQCDSRLMAKTRKPMKK